MFRVQYYSDWLNYWATVAMEYNSAVKTDIYIYTSKLRFTRINTNPNIDLEWGSNR